MGFNTNIYANNHLYKDNYKVGLEYEELFYKMLVKLYEKYDNIKVENTDFYCYKDFNIYKDNELIVQIELKCRLTDTSRFNTLFCDKSKMIEYQFDNEVIQSKQKGCFKEFLLINNCLKEDCFYFNSFDKFEIKGFQDIFKKDLIKSNDINDIFNYINKLVLT